MQEAVDGLIRQVSELAAPGSRICMDMIDRAYLDGTVKNRGFSCGSKVCFLLCQRPLFRLRGALFELMVTFAADLLHSH